MTTERPILMSAPMVAALLAGTKTQTRRVFKAFSPSQPEFDEGSGLWEVFNGDEVVAALRCPYGRPGDQLWVREAWARTTVAGAEMVVYREGDNRTDYGGPWKPGIHMFRRDSRITLTLTDVRVERLAAISEADAIAEGIERSGECNWRDYTHHPHNDFTSARRSYRSLWELINGPGSWEASPWVWALSFTVEKR